MNRRGFFKSMVAGAVMLAAPRIVLPKESAPISGRAIVVQIDQRTVYDLRKAHMEGMAKWWQEQFDPALFASLENRG